MAVEKHISSYLGGMNKDTSTSHQRPEVYVDGHNIRIISGGDGGYDGGNSAPQNDTGTVTNAKGNYPSFDFVGKYLSHTFLRDNLILLTHNKGTVTDIEEDIQYVDYSITAPNHNLSVDDVIGFNGTDSFDTYFFKVSSITDTNTFIAYPLVQTDSVSITNFSGIILVTTTNPHGYNSSGYTWVTLSGTTDYDGEWRASYISATSFIINTAYSVDRSGSCYKGRPFSADETSLVDATWYFPRKLEPKFVINIGSPNYTYRIYYPDHKIPESTSVWVEDLTNLPSTYYLTYENPDDSDNIFDIRSSINATPSTSPVVYVPEVGDDKIYKIPLSLFRTEQVVDVANIVDYGATVSGTIGITTATEHGLATGDLVRFVDTVDYDNEYVVTVLTDSIFYVTAPYIANRSVGTIRFYKNFTLTSKYYFSSSGTGVYFDSVEDKYYYDGLVYRGNLESNPDDNIRMYANYETSEIQKIYWIGDNTILHHLNIVHNADTNNLFTLDPELLKMVPIMDHQSIDVVLQAGGHLSCGRKQWAYQLYKINGAETTFSPASTMINVSPISDDISNAELFRGGELGEIATKSAVVTIDTGTSGDIFDRIRIVCLEYFQLDLPPTVRIVAEQTLLDSTVTVYDYGDSQGEIALEEFQFVQYDLSAGTFTSKNNYLIAANTTDEFFDVEGLYLDEVRKDSSGTDFHPFLDMRAYRWRTYTDGGGGSTETVYAEEDNTKTSLSVKNNESFLLWAGVDYPTFPGLAEGNWKVVIPITSVVPPAGPPTGYAFSAMITDSVFANDFLEIVIDGTDTVWLSMSGATVTYDSGSAEFTITGNWYDLDNYPSQLYFNLANDTTTAVLTSIDYTYTYTYTETVSSGASVSECVINRGLTGEQVVTTSTYDKVLTTNSAINTFNNVNNDTEARDNFIYMSDGSTIGGSGPMLDYRLIDDYDTVWIGQFGSKNPGGHTVVNSPNPWTYNIYMNYTRSAEDAIYMPDEVYRQGVIFYDLKMRPSFVQWIGDIRMPNMRQFNPFSNEGQYNIPQIRYRIDTDAFPTEFWNKIKGYQFVRCQRRASDKSVIAHGILSMCIEDSSNNNYSPIYLTSAADWNSPSTPGAVRSLSNWNAPSSMTHNISGTDPYYSLVEFITPDAAFNKEFAIQSGDYIEAVGNLDAKYEVTSAYTAAAPKMRYYSLTAGKVVTGNYQEINIPSTRDNLWGDVQDGFFSNPEQVDPVSHTVNSKLYFARGTDGGAATTRSETYKGSSVVLDIQRFASTVIPTSAAAGDAIVCNYKRNLGLGMYGGATYNQRSLSVYIPCSEFIDRPAQGGTVTQYIRGGDCYYSYFAFLKSLYDPEYENTTEEDSGQSLITFPTISTINVDWRLDPILNQVSFGDNSTTPNYHLNENARWGISNYPVYYPTNFDLYRYNSVYSTSDASRQFIPTPFDFNSVVSYDTRIRYSDQKIAGEYVDSWLKFRSGNYLDMDGNYGEVVRLLSIHNDLYAFQPFAVSKVSVLDREVLPSNTSQSLSIGSGGVLERYDYITTNSGTDFYDGIVPTERGLYYYDNYTRDIKRITAEGSQSLSEIKGMKSFFNEREMSNVVGIYDKENREVLFSLHHSDTSIYNDTTVVYSLFTDTFVGFQNFTTSKFISKGDVVLSFGSDESSVYRHNVGKYGTFYGTAYDSTISLVVNPLKMRTSSFHTLEFLTNLYNGKTHLPNTTIDSIGLSTSTQTGSTLTSFKQRHRAWRNNLLRDTSGKRIRDNYLRLDITLTDNSNNYKYILHPLITNYSPTKVR